MRYTILFVLLLCGATLAQAGCPEGFVLNDDLQCEAVPACLPGFTLHPENDVCIMKQDDGKKCPAGSSYNKTDKTCESSVACPKNSVFNTDIGKCVEK